MSNTMKEQNIIKSSRNLRDRNYKTQMVELSSLGDVNMPSLNEQNENLLRCFLNLQIITAKNVKVHFRKS